METWPVVINAFIQIEVQADGPRDARAQALAFVEAAIHDAVARRNGTYVEEPEPLAMDDRQMAKILQQIESCGK